MEPAAPTPQPVEPGPPTPQPIDFAEYTTGPESWTERLLRRTKLGNKLLDREDTVTKLCGGFGLAYVSIVLVTLADCFSIADDLVQDSCTLVGVRVARFITMAFLFLTFGWLLLQGNVAVRVVYGTMLVHWLLMVLLHVALLVIRWKRVADTPREERNAWDYLYGIVPALILLWTMYEIVDGTWSRFRHGHKRIPLDIPFMFGSVLLTAIFTRRDIRAVQRKLREPE